MEQNKVYTMQDWYNDRELKVEQNQLVEQAVIDQLCGDCYPTWNTNKYFQAGEADTCLINPKSPARDGKRSFHDNGLVYRTYERVDAKTWRFIGYCTAQSTQPVKLEECYA